MTTTVTTKRGQKRRFLLVLPGLVIPFLFLAFIALGGGKGKRGDNAGKELFGGFNTELPEARFDKAAKEKNKLDYYKEADADSIRKREWRQQDPYYRKTVDTQANFLLRRLDVLKRKIEAPAMVRPVVRNAVGPVLSPGVAIPAPVKPVRDTVEADPELHMLNEMLDKIARMQQPKEVTVTPDVPAAPDVANGAPDSVINSLPAVVGEDQVLVPGGTMALRLTGAVRINGVLFPRDQPVYGVVSISNDRMLININAIRVDQSIYPTVLQVYDLDGLAGIHIPGSLGRETAKQSLEQSIGTMNVLPLDLSPTAQVTNAGVQAAKTLLSRKARQVRVMVKGGYQLLLRSVKAPVKLVAAAAPKVVDSVMVMPEPESFGPFMHKSVRKEKMELRLEGIYLREGLLWVMLRLENHGPIGFVPDHVRWGVRDRRQVRRTAMQEVTMQPLYASGIEEVAGDSSRVMLAAFRPFVLPHDKELVVQMTEGSGARALVMEIKDKDILKARSYGRQ